MVCWAGCQAHAGPAGGAHAQTEVIPRSAQQTGGVETECVGTPAQADGRQRSEAAAQGGAAGLRPPWAEAPREVPGSRQRPHSEARCAPPFREGALHRPAAAAAPRRPHTTAPRSHRRRAAPADSRFGADRLLAKPAQAPAVICWRLQHQGPAVGWPARRHSIPGWRHSRLRHQQRSMPA